MYGDGRRRVVAVSHEAGSPRHEREIGDGGGDQELEEGLRPPEVAGLAHAELHEARQPVFGGLAQLAIRRERLALLQRPRLLQQSLLRVDHDQPAFPQTRPHA
jgi:hypothetical protein